MSDGIADDDELDDGEFGDGFGPADHLLTALQLWGSVEAAIDCCATLLMRKFEPADPLPPYPATLEHKLRYIVETCALPSVPSGALQLARFLQRQINAEKSLRHDIVHGRPLDMEDNGTIHFLLIKRPKRGLPKYVSRSVGPSDWKRFYRVCIELEFLLTTLLMTIDPVDERVFDLPQEELAKWFHQGPANFPGSKRVRQLIQKLMAPFA